MTDRDRPARAATFDGAHIPLRITQERRRLADADWRDDRAEIDAARAELARLEMLAAYGETHDLPF